VQFSHIAEGSEMDSRSLRLLLVTSLSFFLPSFATSAAEPAPDFETEIAPLLIKRCVECHQGRDPSSGLLLTTRAGLFDGGDSGGVIDLESPEQSELLRRVHDGEMPPEKQGLPQPLPTAEIALLERWVAAGADWPKERTLDLIERTTDVRAGRDWWSLQPVSRPTIPKLKSLPQPTGAIDAFILAKLEESGMNPAPLADKRTRLRRLFYDLIGLPPTQAQLQQFEQDASADAWENAIDELLDSPQYGERWARYWLDLVRYADTSGYERDQEKPFAWKYRDWVVDSYNTDLPYDRFIIEQLAGDELTAPSERSVIATGFLRLGTWNDEPNDPLDYQYDRLEDLVHTTSSAFLAMTVKCARCHAHKFDAITHEDYYRMASAFWAGPIAARKSDFLGGPKPDELGFTEVLGWTDLGPNPRPLHLLKNGEREHPLHEVMPASLSMVSALERHFDPPPTGSKTSTRRLQLARWIASPENPLTARVMVNRLWQHHFGEAIVRSPNNFGFLADPPTHPKLLDWLAAEFVSGGWTLKRMHKLILMSSTWQRSSIHPQQAQYHETDPGNRLWWRAERRRLDAEALRDSMLAASDELVLTVGGPGFRPTISPEALEGLSRKSSAWQAAPIEEQFRRSLYIYSKRGLLQPMMTTFDFSDTTQSCGRRDITTVPTQSLTMLNNSFVHQRSEALAVAVDAATPDRQSQVRLLWEKIYQSKPSATELDLALQHLATQQRRLEEAVQTKRPTPRSLARSRTAKMLDQSMVLSLRADRGVTTTPAGLVSEWRDQSGRNHHAWQDDAGQQPTFGRDPFDNGQPAVSFSGQQQFLHLRGTVVQGQPCTIVAVVADRGFSGHRSILSNWNGAKGNFGSSWFLGLTDRSAIRFSDAFRADAQIDNRTEPFMITAMNGPGQIAIFVNSKKIASRDSSLPARNLKTAWVIGQQGNINGEYWNGEIAELRVYSKPLSDDERQLIESELSQRYGITLSSPSPARVLPARVLALGSLAHVLLNSNRFLYVD